MDWSVSECCQPWNARDAMRRRLRAGEVDDKEIEVENARCGWRRRADALEIPGMPGAQIGMTNIGAICWARRSVGARCTRRIKVADATEPLIAEEADKLLDTDAIQRDAIESVEQNGIVFIDENRTRFARAANIAVVAAVM